MPLTGHLSKREVAMQESRTSRKVIEIGKGLFAPTAPRPRTIRGRPIEQFTGVPQAYLDVMKKLSSPLLMGPPISDELLAFVRHLFTEEEAGVVRHLGQ